MKKSELKKILRPLVKECIHEVLLQEGLLSSIVAEVYSGINGTNVLTAAPESNSKNVVDDEVAKQKLAETRNRMLSAIGRDSYKGVNVFEGTTPLSSSSASTSPADPMSNIDPRDPGVDLGQVFGGEMTNNWNKIAKAIK